MSKKNVTPTSKNLLQIVANYGTFSSDILVKKRYNAVDRENFMSRARYLFSKGTLKREKKGVYALNLKKNQKTNENKFREAIKLGSQVDITFVNDEKKVVTRRCTPNSVTLSQTGNIILCFADQKKNAYRSARLDRTKKIDFISK